MVTQLGSGETTTSFSMTSPQKDLNMTIQRFGGTFAKVYVAVHRKTKVQLAVKIMDRVRFGGPEYSGGTNVEQEVAILQTIDHANIVPVVDVIKTTRYIYIFMQMLTGGDLFDYILKSGPMPELEAKFTAYQILQALKHLQEMNISHRDLKPENLLLTSTVKYPRVLLTDFGMAREFCSANLMNTMCGTFAYMAPEVFDVKHAHGPGYGYSADCWSFGVTLYVILSGTHPFTADYATEDEKTMSVAFPSCYWNEISLEAQVLIKNLLVVDPEKRWGVKDALNSAWIQRDAAWLRQRYREFVLTHWTRSSQYLGAVQQHIQTNSQVVPLKRAVSESAHSNECVREDARVADK
ncbi:Serine/threonine-protein kinase D2, partial [Mortierella sp. AD011]